MQNGNTKRPRIFHELFRVYLKTKNRLSFRLFSYTLGTTNSS